MRPGLPHNVLGITVLGAIAVATLPGAVGLFGQVYRVDGGAASAAAVHTATPARTTPVTARPTELAARATPTVVSDTRVDALTSATVTTAALATSTRPPATTTPVPATPTAGVRSNSVPDQGTSVTATAKPRATATATSSPAATPPQSPTLVPTSTPTATSTPDTCPASDGAIVFPTAELRLRSTGSDATKLLIENTGKRSARDVRLSLTVVQARERLRALSLDSRKWDLTTQKQLLVTLGEIPAGTTHGLELTYELGATPSANDVLSKVASDVVELRLEVVGDACPRVSKAGPSSMRIFIEPDTKTPVIATAAPSTDGTNVRKLPAEKADASDADDALTGRD